MLTSSASNISRLLSLLVDAWNAPPGFSRILCAIVYGAATHLLFAVGVGSMVVGMYFGMTLGMGNLQGVWGVSANMLLIAQFGIMHSLLLAPQGRMFMALFAPRQHSVVLAPSVYAMIASVQLFFLFSLWTPSGIVWWQAEGVVLLLMTGLNGLCWLLLLKATYDAGIEVQTGALGWLTLLAGRKAPIYPDMPTHGLFKIIRQPIYVAFALTTWTVPVWTPDQLAIATCLTAYCLLAPLLKERRFAKRYGERFEAYRASTPFAIPRLLRSPR